MHRAGLRQRQFHGQLHDKSRRCRCRLGHLDDLDVLPGWGAPVHATCSGHRRRRHRCSHHAVAAVRRLVPDGTWRLRLRRRRRQSSTRSAARPNSVTASHRPSDNFGGTAIGRAGLLVGLSQGQVAAEACGTLDCAVAWAAVQSQLSTLGARLAAPTSAAAQRGHRCRRDGLAARHRTALRNDRTRRSPRRRSSKSRTRQYQVPIVFTNMSTANLLVTRLSRHRLRCRVAHLRCPWSGRRRSRPASPSAPAARHTPS